MSTGTERRGALGVGTGMGRGMGTGVVQLLLGPTFARHGTVGSDLGSRCSALLKAALEISK